MSMIQELLMSKRSKQFSDDDLIELHHRFMVVYGWIPDFKSIPLPMLWNLADRVNKEYADIKHMQQAMMAMAGVKKK